MFIAVCNKLLSGATGGLKFLIRNVARFHVRWLLAENRSGCLQKQTSANFQFGVVGFLSRFCAFRFLPNLDHCSSPKSRGVRSPPSGTCGRPISRESQAAVDERPSRYIIHPSGTCGRPISRESQAAVDERPSRYIRSLPRARISRSSNYSVLILRRS